MEMAIFVHSNEDFKKDGKIKTMHVSG